MILKETQGRGGNIEAVPPFFREELLIFRRKCSLFAEFSLSLLPKKILKNMITTAIPTQPGRLTVDVEDISMLRDIKKAISMVRGVTKVTVPRRKRLSSYERSLRDLDEGRVYEYDSLDDLIKEIEG